MNALDKYLETNEMRNAAFASVVGSSEATISRLRNGKQTPSYGLIRRIHAATNGAVTANDFMPATREPTAHPDEAA